MLQINKKDKNLERNVQYANPNLVTNIIRINRFYFEQKINIKEEEIRINLVENEVIKGKKDHIEGKFKEKKKIYFKVFAEFPCEIEINSEFFF